MRAEGRSADADDAMKQRERIRAILFSDRELVAAYNQKYGEGENADRFANKIERRGLDL